MAETRAAFKNKHTAAPVLAAPGPNSIAVTDLLVLKLVLDWIIYSLYKPPKPKQDMDTKLPATTPMKASGFLSTPFDTVVEAGKGAVSRLSGVLSPAGTKEGTKTLVESKPLKG